MCGIAGFSLNPLADSFSPDFWIETLALAIESRGWDATGVLTWDKRGKVRVAKAADTAEHFFKHRSGIGKSARLALIHTRLATQGSKKNNVNNHPISNGTIIGIHNGMIDNDHTLFRENVWHRNGEVDSEAIFAAIHHLGAVAGLESIDGSMAVAWIDTLDPGTLWLARGQHSPLYIYQFTNGLFFASTAAALQALAHNKIEPEEIKEGTILCIRDGLVVERIEFTPMPPRTRWTPRNSYGTINFATSTLGLPDDDWRAFDGIADHIPRLEPAVFKVGDIVRSPFTNITGTITASRWTSKDGHSYEVQWDGITWEDATTLAGLDESREDLKV